MQSRGDSGETSITPSQSIRWIRRRHIANTGVPKQMGWLRSTDTHHNHSDHRVYDACQREEAQGSNSEESEKSCSAESEKDSSSSR